MRQPLEFFSEPLPGASAGNLCGKLITLEGPAAVGLTTQIALLRDLLEDEGHAVRVCDPLPPRARSFSDAASALRELAAFALALESDVLPALRAGCFVLAGGWAASWIARREARGLPGDWLRQLASFALVPHASLYLRAGPAVLAARAANRGFGEEESAADLRLGGDLCDSFLKYQERVIAALDGMAKDYRLVVVDAGPAPDRVFRRVLREVRKL